MSIQRINFVNSQMFHQCPKSISSVQPLHSQEGFIPVGQILNLKCPMYVWYFIVIRFFSSRKQHQIAIYF